MTDSLELLSLAFAGFGTALGLFFAAALFLSRVKLPANIYLAGFCACFALLLMWDIVIVLFRRAEPVWMNSAMDWAFLMMAPLFYFYVRVLCISNDASQRMLGLSLLPAMLSFGWVSCQIYSAPPSLTPNTDFMPAAYTYAYFFVAIVQLIGYVAAAYLLVRTHAKRAEESFSMLQGVDLRWLRMLIVGAALAAMVWVTSIFVRGRFADALSTTLPSLIVLILGMLAQNQRPLPIAAQSISQQPKSRELTNGSLPKYTKSGLTSERMSKLAQRLEKFMAQDKAFLESHLTLDQLASRTSISSHQLSQVFNQYLRVSFFEYINRMRVREVERCLSDRAFAGQSLLEIGLAAGFNSKAAFNAAFKRFTGTTPSAYRATAGKSQTQVKSDH